MKKLIFLALGAFSSVALAQTAEKKDAAPAGENVPTQAPLKIDVSKMPRQAQIIDDVVVPKPDEIFSVLDKIDRPLWHEVLRKAKVKPTGGQEQIALLLGTVIAEGFIAVEAEDTEAVKNIGNTVLNLAKAINVQKSVLDRSKAIIEGADRKNWAQVRRELDKAQGDVKEAMIELKSEELSQLISLGGWLRGTEALTDVIERAFKKDSAELLHQPVLVDYFDRRLAAMKPSRKNDPVVMEIHKGLIEIRPLMGANDGADISEKSVKEIGAIAERLIKSIQSKSNKE